MTPIQHSLPALNLRMKASSEGPEQVKDSELLADQVEIMAQQEMNAYRCGDYLSDPSFSSPSYSCGFVPADQTLDALARKKMIDWKYRLVDHYGISREMVATSTSILDRFVFHHGCNRMTFKLAAVTSLYMAAKVHDQGQLSPTKLATLSKGEFCVEDIVDMEFKILQALQWRVNPVTVHTFIHAFLANISPAFGNPLLTRAIYDRAIFFAELCLFDYSYVSRHKSSIAAAAILNALEGINDRSTPGDSEKELLCSLQGFAGIAFSGESLDDLREDLWYVYSLSAQYHDDDLQMTMPEEEGVTESEKHGQRVGGGSATAMHVSDSPVSVLSRRSS